MVCAVPACQLSPPFGEVTVITGLKIEKLASDTSLTVPVAVLVITTV